MGRDYEEENIPLEVGDSEYMEPQMQINSTFASHSQIDAFVSKNKQLFSYSENLHLDCPICLNIFITLDSTISLKCDSRHIYHSKCLVKLLKNEHTKNICSLCREPI